MTDREIESILYYFRYTHLPEKLQEVSKPFHDLAQQLSERPWNDPAQLKIGLRKLLEAKDCVVRAALS